MFARVCQMCVGLVSEVCEFVFEGVPDVCRNCSEKMTMGFYVGRLLVGCWLVAGWLLAGCWLFAGWLLAGCWLVA